MEYLANNPNLTIDSLSGGDKTSRGAFEELMRSVNSHLEDQLEKGNITKQQYASMYSGALASTMSEASKYVLSYMTTNQQIKLLDWQIKEAENRASLVAEQILQLKEQTSLISKQIELAELEKSIKVAQEDQILKETLLTEARTITEGYNATLTNNNASRTSSEKAVLDQKLLTEQAQIKDSINGVDVAGIIGRQRSLYENQAEGYIRDAEQKAAKIFMDSFNTRTSIETTEATEPSDATLTGIQIKSVLNQLRKGVGVSEI